MLRTAREDEANDNQLNAVRTCDRGEHPADQTTVFNARFTVCQQGSGENCAESAS
jgi:hypothetical protein